MRKRLRILYLLDIMLERTDEEHVLNASQIGEILQGEYNISVDRRTVYMDLEALEYYGIEIVQRKGKNSGYYALGRNFELPELKLLVDAVQASKFITEKKSKELIEKLEKLCSKYQGKILEKQVFILNRPKNENETIYYNVDFIHTAIYENKQIVFHYTEWSMKKEIHFRHEKMLYKISPWSLTWNNENYYLIGYDEDKEEIRHYRVDKIWDINILNIERNGRKDFENFSVVEFSKKTFGMYGGHDEEIVMIGHQKLVGVVIDHFGHDVFMYPVDEEHFKMRAIVTVSQQFFGWLTGLGKNIEIIEPVSVREEYKNYLIEILNQY